MRNVSFLAMLLGIVSGCLNPCGTHYLLTEQWIEPDLYDTLPEDGIYEGYRVVRHVGSRPDMNWAGVGKDIGSGHIGMMIETDDQVLLSWRNPDPIAADETEAGIRAMFSAIGITGPVHLSMVGQWNRTSTC